MLTNKEFLVSNSISTVGIILKDIILPDVCDQYQRYWIELMDDCNQTSVLQINKVDALKIKKWGSHNMRGGNKLHGSIWLCIKMFDVETVVHMWSAYSG